MADLLRNQDASSQPRIDSPPSGFAATMDQSPDQMPEIPREIMILTGAIESLDMRLRELRTKLSPITLEPPNKTPEMIKESLEVHTEYGAKLRELSTQVGDLETRLTYLLFHVQV